MHRFSVIYTQQDHKIFLLKTTIFNVQKQIVRLFGLNKSKNKA